MPVLFAATPAKRPRPVASTMAHSNSSFGRNCDEHGSTLERFSGNNVAALELPVSRASHRRQSRRSRQWLSSQRQKSAGSQYSITLRILNLPNCPVSHQSTAGDHLDLTLSQQRDRFDPPGDRRPTDPERSRKRGLRPEIFDCLGLFHA